MWIAVSAMAMKMKMKENESLRTERQFLTSQINRLFGTPKSEMKSNIVNTKKQ